MMKAEERNGIKVSIIVPIYKVAPYLDELIQSILAQTHRNIEAILVDDGSPDSSGEICDQYAAKDSRIIVVHQPNKGCCEARNEGLRRITGDWFTFIDGDDWIAPDYVEYLLDIAIAMNAEMAIVDSMFTTRDLNQNEHDDICQWTQEKASANIIRSKELIGCVNKLYNTAMWKRSGVTFDVPWGGEGFYFASLVAQRANYIAKGHRRIYVYRKNNPTSSLTSNDMKVAINFLETVSRLGKVTAIKTPVFMRALEWREWVTFRLVLRKIIANHAQIEYFRLYMYCRMKLLLLLPGVLRHKQYGKGYSPMKIFKYSIFPSYFARQLLIEMRNRLELDVLAHQYKTEKKQ